MVLAEVFLGAFLQVLFERLASPRLLELAESGWDGNTSLLMQSRKSLSQLRAVLADAEQKQGRSEAVREWLNDLQALTYDLDDIVDDLLYEHTRRKFLAESRAIKYSYDINSKLGDIIERLRDLIEEKNDLGLLYRIPSSSNRIAERLPPTSWVDESSVQGRDNDKEAVLRLVLDDTETHEGIVGIIPIVGMGGVGKTTLAQLVYNDTKLMKDHFDLKAWVCVSEEFDVFKLTKIIFQSVTGESGDHLKDLNTLQVALKERISNKKFLIVLDDVWNENYDKWELLQLPFQVGQAGSKIVVTTRNNEVVSTMCWGQPYRLTKLSHADSISLFAQNSLGVQNFDAYPSFKMIGEAIVKKCGGLPLALKTLWKALVHKKESRRLGRVAEE